VTCAEAPPDERAAAYQEFRRGFDAGDFAVALPSATRVVDLTRNQFGKDAPQLANPLTNLGTTYYRLKRFGEALDSYREALTLLDLAGNATDERLVRPLHGMGAALRGLTRDAEAITPFKRAVEILRNREGLYTASQLPLLKELVACHTAAAGPTPTATSSTPSPLWKRPAGRPADAAPRMTTQWQEPPGVQRCAGAARTAVQLADAKLGGATRRSAGTGASRAPIVLHTCTGN
jgi:tetratricopeptide (TPR) repeat protein